MFASGDARNRGFERALALAGAALLVLALWGAALYAFWQSAQARAAAQARLAAIRPDLSGQVGVNLEAAELAGTSLESTLARLERAGIRWLRFTVAWDAVEPERGRYDWPATDRIFGALAGHPALNLLVVLDRSPAWARAPADRENPLAPPHERADFGAFAAAVAQRYGPQIRYYQVWHEPNIAPHWGARPADPSGYVGLLREAAVQIRAADADASIVLAALAPTTESSGANMSDLAFLEGIYITGGQAWFDVAAAEPYGFSQPVDAAGRVDQLNFGRVALWREVMSRRGDGATPIWATAFGWNALPAGWSGAASIWGDVSEEAQARHAEAAIEAASTRWPWLGPLFWAADCPSRPAGDPWRGFALCAADGSLRPVGTALASAAGRPPVVPPGDHAPDHPALHYSANWRVTARAADPGASGDTLSFDFYGAGLKLRVQGGPYWALYRITVDGQPANALPRDEDGAAYLVLYDPLAEVRVVEVARDLPLGRHQASVEASGGWGQWALQGVLVGDAPARAGRPAGLGLAALATLATALWAILRWRSGSCRACGWLAAAAASLRRLLDRAALAPDALLWSAAGFMALLLVISDRTALDLAALVGLGTIFLVRPDAALPLAAAAIPLSGRAKPLLGRDTSLYEIFIWVCLAALVARGALAWLAAGRGESGGKRSAAAAARRIFAVGSPPRPLDWAMLALLCSGLISTLAADRQAVALREFRRVFLDGALFYWLITRAPSPRAGGRFSPWPLLHGLLAGMTLVSGLALWQLATGQGRIEAEGVWRVRAFFGSPNNLALVLGRAIPLALALAAFAPGSRPDRWPWLRRAAYGAVALLSLIACVATFSRGALLLGLPAGMAVVLMGGAWRSRRRWPWGLLLALVLLAVPLLLVLARTPRFADLFDFQSGTSFFRLKLWQAAWRMGLDHPWLGVGPDNFLYAYRAGYVLPSAWQELNLSHPHNIVLDLWTRLGLLGVLAGGWALAAAAQRGVRLLRAGSVAVWPVALGLLGGLAALLAHGLVDNSLFLVDLMGLFALAAGTLRRLEPPGA